MYKTRKQDIRILVDTVIMFILSYQSVITLKKTKCDIFDCSYGLLFHGKEMSSIILITFKYLCLQYFEAANIPRTLMEEEILES